MIHEDDQVIGMNTRLLWRALKEIPRILNQILIQWIAARDENRQRGLLPPSGPPGLLPSAGYRAWIAIEYTRLQLADIDAQLQRVRADYAADLPAA
ncbi:hypothetical protein D3C85_1065900 [compost metagenome]